MYTSQWSDFSNSHITYINLNYDPLNEYINVLDKLRADCNQDELRLSVFKRFKSILNRLLSGVPIDGKLLTDTLEYCKKTRLKMDFLSNAKILYQLVSFIDVKEVVCRSLTRAYELETKEIAILCKNIEHWNFIYSLMNKETRKSFYPVYRKTIRENYINGPLFIIAPSYWIKDFLAYPSSETTYVLQPFTVGNSNFEEKLFKLNGKLDIGININNKISTSIEPLVIEGNVKYIHWKSTQPTEKTISLQDAEKMMGVHSHITCKEIEGKDGTLNYIQTNKNYIIINKEGVIENRSFEENDSLYNILYIVQDIDYSKMSHEDVNQEYRKQMEKWKKPLREYYRPYELPSLLKNLGAQKATEQNVKNWSKSSTIAPIGREDYLAVLTFAGIDTEEEIDVFYKLARNMRSNSISLGHKKSDVAKEIIRKAINDLLVNKLPITNEISVGNLKAQILSLKSN